MIKLKLFTALTLFFALTFLFSSQLTQLAEANNNNHYPTPTPTTNPTTGPVTGPVTGPITGPAGLFKITGKIKYHILGLFWRSASRFLPAAGVKVKAVDVFNSHHSFTAMTDPDGNYTITPGKAGFYKVTVSGGKAKFYVPPVRFVQDNKPEGKSHVDFEGLIFKF